MVAHSQGDRLLSGAVGHEVGNHLGPARSDYGRHVREWHSWPCYSEGGGRDLMGRLAVCKYPWTPQSYGMELRLEEDSNAQSQGSLFAENECLYNFKGLEAQQIFLVGLLLLLVLPQLLSMSTAL